MKSQRKLCRSRSLFGLLGAFIVVTCSFPLVIMVGAEEPVCAVGEDCSAKHDSTSWFDSNNDSASIKWLQKNVFGQKPKKAKDNLQRSASFGKLTGDATPNEETSSSKEKEKGILATLKEILESDDPHNAMLNFFLKKSASNEDTSQAASFQDTAQIFMDHAKEVMDQLQRVVGNQVDDLMNKYFHLPSAWYLLRHEQEHKHAYWKTLQHKYFDKVTDTEFFRQLHEALYLANIAYFDTETELREGLAKVENDHWQLLYCDVQGNPSEPAHFLAVEKQAAALPKKKGGRSFWQKAGLEKEEEDILNVIIVVRGTKTMADVLSDGLLEAVTFKEKHKAHGGIATSGKYIANKHIERLKQLLEASGRSKLQVLLFGHSLGCGTAAIAAMEFHDNFSDIMNVRAVGFGCPSLVSPELSEQYKDIITTVVADADVVPRLSGSSIINLHLSMLSLDWTDYMWEETKDFFADIIKDVTKWSKGVGPATKLVSDLLEKVGGFLKKEIATKLKPAIHECRDKAIPEAFPVRKADNELIPPGTCLHLYRTATGFEAAYTPCSFFDEIEYVPHLVADHLCGSGYHLALLTLLRQGLNDRNAVFDNEI